jgi:hypothetical protein
MRCWTVIQYKSKESNKFNSLDITDYVLSQQKAIEMVNSES